MNIKTAKEKIRQLKADLLKGIDDHESAILIDYYLSDLIDDLQENDEPVSKSDFKEHNILNHKELGL